MHAYLAVTCHLRFWQNDLRDATEMAAPAVDRVSNVGFNTQDQKLSAKK